MNGFMLTAAGTPIFTILYMAVIVGFFYFFLIRPQRKEQKEKQAMLNALAIGDSVLTTAGFYGVVQQQELPHSDAEGGDRSDREA